MTALALTSPNTLSLFPRQMRFVQDSARYPAAIGGIGSGKTFVGAAKVVSRVGRNEFGLICAPTYKMLRDATQRTLFDMFKSLGIEYVHHKGDNHATIPATGHEVIFRSLDDPDNLRGPNVAYTWVDEAAYITADAWRIVKGRTRVGDKQQAWITGTPKGRNWIWEEWVRDANGEHPLYRFRTDENPTLDAGFAASLGYEGRFAAQELGGEFVSFEGLVYAAFDRGRNVREVDTDGWRTVAGVDVGARNPTVVLTIHIAGDGRVHVSREFYQRGMGSTAILDAIESEAAISNPDSIYIDPSSAAYIDDLLSHGFPAEKANNDVRTGIQQVTSAMPMLTVDPSCINTITEFESYQYPDEGRGTSDKPIKQMDHCLIAGTMVETEHGPCAIETITAGDLVLTRNGYEPVIAAGMTNPAADVLTVHLSDGRTITGTAGHPVWVGNRGGWNDLDTLRYGDILETWQGEWTPSHSMASYSGDIRMLSGGQIAPTTSPAGIIASVASGACTKRFGRPPMAPFLRATISITSMATTSTMTPPTSNASPLMSIVLTTLRSADRCIRASFSGSRSNVRRRQSGTAPKMAGRGTGRMVGTHGSIGSLFVSSASSAALVLTTSPDAMNRASAPTSASRHGDEHPALTTKIASVRHAAKRSGSTVTARREPAPVSVVRVSAETERQPVYNLTVANTPEYFANGVLVHNCMDALRYAIMGAAELTAELGVW